MSDSDDRRSPPPGEARPASPARLSCSEAHARRVLLRYMSPRLAARVLREMAGTARPHRDAVLVAETAVATAGAEPSDLDVARAKKFVRERRRRR